MVNGLDFIKGVGTAKVSNLLFLIAFVTIFAINRKIDYIVAIPLVLSMSLGGYLGSKIAIKKGNKLIRWIFILIIFAMAIRLFFM